MSKEYDPKKHSVYRLLRLPGFRELALLFERELYNKTLGSAAQSLIKKIGGKI
jgi:hypothetical protein